jgi:hypothetical protein
MKMSSKTSSLLFELAHSIAVIVAGLIGWLFGYPSIFAGSMAMFFGLDGLGLVSEQTCRGGLFLTIEFGTYIHFGGI